MATEKRRAGPDIAGLWEAAARLPKLGFYATLWLLERLTTGSPRIGEAQAAHEEAVRLRHDASLAFPSSDIASVTPGGAAEPEAAPHAAPTTGASFTGFLGNLLSHVDVTSTFLGLSGTASPLPSYLLEDSVGEFEDARRAREFLDLFHHRALSLLFRLVSKHTPAYEASSDASDSWSTSLFALGQAGHGTVGLAVDHLARLIPLFADSRDVRALEVAIEEALAWSLERSAGPLADPPRCPRARVEQFAGAWATADEDQRTALGRNCRLGSTAILGAKRLVYSGTLRIHIGPLDSNTHARLANGDLRELVGEVIAAFSREPVDHELVLDLPAQERRGVRLGVDASGRLGVDAWLGAAVAAPAPRYGRQPVPVVLARGSSPARTQIPGDRAQTLLDMEPIPPRESDEWMGSTR